MCQQKKQKKSKKVLAPLGAVLGLLLDWYSPVLRNPPAVHKEPGNLLALDGGPLSPDQFPADHVALVEAPSVLGKLWAVALVNQASFALATLCEMKPGSV